MAGLNPFQIYQAFMQNPMQALQSKFNIPADISSDPNAILQHLLNTRQVNQQQVNGVMGMKNSPFVQQLLGKKY